jgi:aminocarboxymuconate-semialdehyde decarboxylase
MVKTIDVHSHFFPKRLFEELGKKYPELDFEMANENGEVNIKIGKVRYFGKVKSGFIDAREIINDMNKRGIDVSVISFAPLSFFYHLSERPAIELYSKYNELASELCKSYPGRLICLASVPLQVPKDAVQELKRGVRELGLKGVAIGTNVNGRNLDDKEFTVFFEEVSKLRVPILIHPADVAARDRLANYYLINLIGNPLDTTIAASSLIFGGVLSRFRDLKVILMHGGGFIPYQIGRLDHGFKVRKEAKEKISELPSKFLNNFYFDTITHNINSLEFLIRQVGANRVVMGSDYPFDMGYDDPVSMIKSLNVNEGVKELILGKNLEMLFQIGNN